MKVRDVMTKNPITVSPDDTVSYALDIIHKFRIWSIPVIQEEKIVGIITKQDINSKSKNHKQKISDIMSKTPLIISPDEELTVAAGRIKKAGVNALIVTDGTALVGIITKKDIKKPHLKFKEEKIARTSDSDTIPELEPTSKPAEKTELGEEPPISSKNTLYEHPNKYIRWFFRKKHPKSRLRVKEFSKNFAILIGLIILFWIVYIIKDELNVILIDYLQLGALILIILLIAILVYLYKLPSNLRYGIRGLANGYKAIASIAVVFVSIIILFNSSFITNYANEFDFNSFNPIKYTGGNGSSSDNSPSTQELETGAKSVTLTYYLHGTKYNISYTVYQGLNDYLASLPREMSGTVTTRDCIMRDINHEGQRELLEPLVQEIQSINSDKDTQAKIAISIVQSIPYDWVAFNTSTLTSKYPYEVLYTQKGVCGEKSELLIFLLRELGFDVVSFEFEHENHRAVGVKCPLEYSYDDTGYCFVETVKPTIITDSEGNYTGVGKLTSYPLVITISSGLSFNSVSEEYNDAKEYNRLNKLSEASGGILSQGDYNEWLELVNKYGL